MIADFNSTLSIEQKLNYFHPVSIPIRSRPSLSLLVDSGLFEYLNLLFPNATIGLRNSIYAAVQTRDLSGKKQTLYLRRIFADLMMRGFGVNRPKGYVVETINDNPFDLRLCNLNILDSAPRRARNTWLTHFLVGKRLEALSLGICPDVYIDMLIAENSGGMKDE